MDNLLFVYVRSLLLLVSLSSTLITSAQVVPDANGIVYVTPTGSGDGSGWDDATSDLQGAIDAAGTQKVFVAIGNYDVPSPHSFVMKNGVAIYGGFNPAAGITVLEDARILPIHGASEGSVLNGKNERPVVWNNNIGLTNSAVLDGFTITNGRGSNGGGIYNSSTYGSGSPIFRNLVVKENHADGDGGGIYNGGSPSKPTILNCIIKGNTARQRGGGIYVHDSAPQLTNLEVTGNTATFADGGGGIFIYAGSGVFVKNVTVAGNIPNAANASGWIFLHNSIIYGGIANSNYDNTHCLITNTGAEELFNYPESGDFRLKSGSPAINAGDNSLYPGLGANTLDLAGNARVHTAAIDIGAYEFHSALPEVVITPDADGIVYVKKNAVGNGSDWANATGRLQGAINAAGTQKVFVAAGNYPIALFYDLKMKNGVAVYGGFDPDNGIDDLGDPRILPDPDNAATGSILNGAKSRSVVFNHFTDADALNSTAVLDGFMLTNGKTGADGGGIYNEYASPVLTNLVISNNEAAYGGGVFNRNSSPEMSHITITANKARLDGGGIFNITNSSPVLTSIVITANNASYGGGVFNRNASSPVLTNTVIKGNSVLNDGGGMYNDDNSAPVLTNTTIVDNWAAEGAGVFNRNSTAAITNSIIYGGVSGTYTAHYSLIEGNTNFTNGNINAETVVDTDLFTDPWADDYTLKKEAPVVNAGNNSAVPSGITTDLAGHDRVARGTVDMGAYEDQSPCPAAAILYVDMTAAGSNDGSSWANALTSLAYAIKTAHECPDVTTILVARGTYYPQYIPPASGAAGNRDKSFYFLRDGLSVLGGYPSGGGTRNPTANPTLLSGDLDPIGTEDAYHVVLAVGPATDAPLTHTLVLDGFTVTGGNADGSGTISVNSLAVSRSNGGGMYNHAASPTITNCIFWWNRTTGNGGGMYNDHSSPVITNSRFSGNTAAYGGGMYNASSLDLVITNNVFSGNRATHNGGGMYSDNSSPAIINSSFSGNAASSGGGMYHASSSPEITNCIIYQNSSGIAATDVLTVSYSIVQGGYSGTGNLDADPLFVDAPLHATAPFSGGNYALQPGSPAIDNGNNASYPGLDNTTEDLAGKPRLKGIAIDRGAYEYQPLVSPDVNGIVYVKENATGAGDSWSNATGNLQAAIDASGTQKVLVATGNYDVPSPHSFVMKEGVEIYGGFDPLNGIEDLEDARILPNQGAAEGSVLNGKDERPVIFNDDNSLTASALLDGFTITSGYRNSNGGGIYCYNVSPTFRNLVIKENTTVNAGAGMFINNSSPSVTNSIISGNTAGGVGGGVINAGTSSPVFTNVRITDNTAGGVEGGGGVYYIGTGNAVFNNVTIAGNVPDAVTNTLGSITAKNAVIFGGITGTYTAQYSLIAGNTDLANSNMDPTGILPGDIFTDAANGDYTLKDCSPAVNSGTPDAAGLPAQDLAGQARVYGGRVDMGAYENSSAPAGQGIASDNSTAARLQHANGTTAYLDACNAALVSVTTQGLGTDISGSTTARVWIDDLQPAQYVRRHYEITPGNNAGTATGRVTLYFTQEDFDAFNAANPAAQIQIEPSESSTNLLIEKRGGESSDGTGRPNTYPGTPENITEVDVTWNAVAQRWEVSFYTTGFSGFFVKTTTSPLPVRWITFSARLDDGNRAVLDWKVDESLVSYYEVERSSNARDFRRVTTMPGQGNGIRQYSFIDPITAAGRVYYRIRQVDLDGSYSYSSIVTVAAHIGIQFRTYPNPAREKVTVEIGPEYVGTRLNLVSTAGIVLRQIAVTEPVFTLYMEDCAPGIYLLSTFDGKVVKLIRE